MFYAEANADADADAANGIHPKNNMSPALFGSGGRNYSSVSQLDDKQAFISLATFNPFIPVSEVDSSIMLTASRRGIKSKIKNRKANRVDPDEMARYEPSHLDLHCLHRYLFWSAGLKG